MAKVLVYDPDTNKIYTYPNLSESDPMPYSYRLHPAGAGVPGLQLLSTPSGPPPPPWRPGT